MTNDEMTPGDMTDPNGFDHITLAHGNGGRLMRELIEQLFAAELANPLLDTDSDAVALPMEQGEWMVTTDGFTVQPLEFPGGNIGSLAVHGTVNDLAVSGARPRFLTLNAFIEEGLSIPLLRRLVASIGAAAREAGVVVVAGDTKVVPRGEGSGVTFATTGIGIRPSSLRLSIDRIEVGDQLLVSGSVGDHGTSVLLARESFGLRGNLSSDSASIFPLAEIAVAVDGLRFMRDPTRGGVATVANEIARRRGAGVVLREADIPLNDEVRSVCEILGYDPLYLACEGRVVAVARPDAAREILSRWQNHEQGRGAAIIGTVVDLHHGEVALLTPLGGERLLHELEDDPLPRIC